MENGIWGCFHPKIPHGMIVFHRFSTHFGRFWDGIEEIWGSFWDFGVVAGGRFGILGFPPEPGTENSQEKPEQERQAGNFSGVLWDEAQSQTGNDWEGQERWEKGKGIFLGMFGGFFIPKFGLFLRENPKIRDPKNQRPQNWRIPKSEKPQNQ